MMFKGKIEAFTKQEINKQLKANVNWTDLSVSLFKNFPDLSISLTGFSITGVKKFEKDTLVGVNDFTVSVDLLSAISSKSVRVNSVELIHPVINAIVLADSTVNWDIIALEEDSITNVSEVTSENDFIIELKELLIQDGVIVYKDETMSLICSIHGLDMALSGDMSASETQLDLTSVIKSFSLSMEESNYLNNVGAELTAKIHADLDKMVFTFNENELLINKLPLSFEGTVGLPDEGYDLDLNLSTVNSQFSSIMNLIPEEYTSYFKDVESSGEFSLSALAKGRYVDEDNLPAFSIGLEIKNGHVKYPDLPESIDNINVDMIVRNNGGVMDNTIVEMSNCHIEIAKNSFDANLNIKTPISNLTYSGGMLGNINFDHLKNAIPLDSTHISGLLNADVKFKGDVKSIEDGEYENLGVNGHISLKEFKYSTLDSSLLDVEIKDANLTFSPKSIVLNNFESSYGRSDFNLKGNISDYLGYALGEGIIVGNLIHSSSYINVNEILLSQSSDEEIESTDTTAITLFEVPKDIDFVFTSSINKLVYDKLDVDNIDGKIYVKDGIVKLESVGMKLLNGDMSMSGQYNTQDLNKPFVDFVFKANSIDLNKTANSFSVIDSLLPIAKHSKGLVSSNLNYHSLLNNEMKPVISTITGGGNLLSKFIEVSNSKVLDGMANVLKQDKYKTLKAEDLNVIFKLEDGKIKVEPFVAKVFDKEIHVQGEQGFDQSLNYLVKTPVTGGDVATALGFNSGSGGSDKDYMVNVIIKGTAKDPKLSLDVSDAQKEMEKDLKKEAEKVVKDVLKDDKVKKKINDFLKGF